MLHCGDCEKFFKMSDGINGVCSVPDSYFPTDAETECVYLKRAKKTTCGDCAHFGNDTACMTQNKDDAICCGFKHVLEEQLVNILMEMLLEGYYSHEKINKICEEFEASPEYKFVSEKIKEQNND